MGEVAIIYDLRSTDSFHTNKTDAILYGYRELMDFEEFPGIQSVCMKLVFRMCQFYPELMDELKRTLEAMEIDYYKPAVKCVRNRILSMTLQE